jgi:hypothetical protein
MHPSPQFLGVVRQYAALEARMNKDFSAPILQFAAMEIDRLVGEGNSRPDAEAQVNLWLAQEVKRFPVQYDSIPF